MHLFRPKLMTLTLFLALEAGAAVADLVTLQSVTEWKAVFGTVEARDRIPARARLGGTVVDLTVSEGDLVEAGQALGRIVDDKLDFQLAALKAQREALTAELGNAEADLKRGEDLLLSGATTTQRVDALQTQVNVLTGQLAALDAQMQGIEQQVREGVIEAPEAGLVLDVPVAKGAVVMPGEAVAVIAGGGTFLRLTVPERHATALKTGDIIRISDGLGDHEGRLAKVYPLIEGGRVTADVEIADLASDFIGTRLLVHLPVGAREALLVPRSAVVTRSGLDFVALETHGLRSVVLGESLLIDGTEMVEILSGLTAGDVIAPLAGLPAETDHD